MGAAILAFFTGPLGKIAMYAIGALAAAGILWAAVHHYESIISENSRLEAANAQYAQTIKDQQKAVKDAEALMKIQSDSIDTLQDQVNDTQANFDTVNEFIKSKGAMASDRPASDILKNTVRKLKELQK